MSYYTECSRCGCNLDPGEKCECATRDALETERIKKFTRTERSGQMRFVFDNKEDNK